MYRPIEHLVDSSGMLAKQNAFVGQTVDKEKKNKAQAFISHL